MVKDAAILSGHSEEEAYAIYLQYIHDNMAREITCYMKNTNVINFEKVRQEVMERYRESLDSPENDPTKRDFSTSGPLEKALTTQLVLFFVKTYILEFMLKTLFVSLLKCNCCFAVCSVTCSCLVVSRLKKSIAFC